MKQALAQSVAEKANPKPKPFVQKGGLTPQQINKVLEKAWSNDEAGPDWNDNCCQICFDDFEDGERFRTMPVCEHKFHSNCIDTRLRFKNECVACKMKVIIEE